MIMYHDWEAQTAGAITSQVCGFGLLVLGIFVLTATRDSKPGCRHGFNALMGRPPPRSHGHGGHEFGKPNADYHHLNYGENHDHVDSCGEDDDASDFAEEYVSGADARNDEKRPLTSGSCAV